MTSQPSLDPQVAIETLVQLDHELGDIDPDARAIVGLRPGVPGTVALVDVTLRDNGILEVADDVAGLVVVTAENVSSDDTGDGLSGGDSIDLHVATDASDVPADDVEVVALPQLVCILRDGTEIGLYRVASDDQPRIWRTDAEPDEGDLRPRDVASNTARRALGLASLVEPVPIEGIMTRTWLLAVASSALRAFDTTGGPREVGPEDLEVSEFSPLRSLVADDDDRLPTWGEVHRAAVGGELDLGSHLTVDPVHAAWLDCDAFAQVLDRTLPSIDELLGTLRVTGDDDLLAWVIGHLSTAGESHLEFA